MKKVQYFVTSLDAGQRIDKYLKKVLSNCPSSLVYKLLRKQDVKVNNKKVDPNYITLNDDEVVVYLTNEQYEEFITPYSFSYISKPFDIIYEDDNLLVINKSRGQIVHSDINESVNTVTNMVLSYLKDKKEFNPANRGYIPSPINRLDKETSGVILFAKNIMTNQIIADYLAKSSVEKHYLALVRGKLTSDGIIDDKLSKDHEKRGLVSVDEKGKPALTRYKLIKQIGGKSLVDVNLITGRSNQIRVHFANIGYPLVGDRKYNNKENENMLCLHCQSMKFGEVEGELTYLSHKEFSAPLASDMEKYINNLE